MIAARELTFRYRADLGDLFDGLSHTFGSGTVTGLVGPSGCGKSTLLFMLGLLLTPTGGRVELDGAAVSMWSDRGRAWVRATKVGFVFQDAALDPARTVLDNVLEPTVYLRRPRARCAAEAEALLARFGVELSGDRLPGQISGGQAQRVALCRALVNHPDVILADEPTGNLDRAAGRWVTNALREIAGDGGTVIIATHDPSVVERCDDVLQLG